jgi:hypothetical protein
MGVCMPIEYIKILMPLAPSVNKLYVTGRNGRFKSPIAKEFDFECSKILEGLSYGEQDKIAEWRKEDTDLDIRLYYYMPKIAVRTTKGTRRKKDFINLEKAQIDSLFSALDMDDSQIMQLTKVLQICEKDQEGRCEVFIRKAGTYEN